MNYLKHYRQEAGLPLNKKGGSKANSNQENEAKLLATPTRQDVSYLTSSVVPVHAKELFSSVLENRRSTAGNSGFRTPIRGIQINDTPTRYSHASSAFDSGFAKGEKGGNSQRKADEMVMVSRQHQSVQNNQPLRNIDTNTFSNAGGPSQDFGPFNESQYQSSPNKVKLHNFEGYTPSASKKKSKQRNDASGSIWGPDRPQSSAAKSRRSGQKQSAKKGTTSSFVHQSSKNKNSNSKAQNLQQQMTPTPLKRNSSGIFKSTPSRKVSKQQTTSTVNHNKEEVVLGDTMKQEIIEQFKRQAGFQTYSRQNVPSDSTNTAQSTNANTNFVRKTFVPQTKQRSFTGVGAPRLATAARAREARTPVQERAFGTQVPFQTQNAKKAKIEAQRVVQSSKDQEQINNAGDSDERAIRDAMMLTTQKLFFPGKFSKELDRLNNRTPVQESHFQVDTKHLRPYQRQQSSPVRDMGKVGASMQHPMILPSNITASMRSLHQGFDTKSMSCFSTTSTNGMRAKRRSRQERSANKALSSNSAAKRVCYGKIGKEQVEQPRFRVMPGGGAISLELDIQGMSRLPQNDSALLEESSIVEPEKSVKKSVKKVPSQYAGSLNTFTAQTFGRSKTPLLTSDLFKSAEKKLDQFGNGAGMGVRRGTNYMTGQQQSRSKLGGKQEFFNCKTPNKSTNSRISQQSQALKRPGTSLQNTTPNRVRPSNTTAYSTLSKQQSYNFDKKEDQKSVLKTQNSRWAMDAFLTQTPQAKQRKYSTSEISNNKSQSRSTTTPIDRTSEGLERVNEVYRQISLQTLDEIGQIKKPCRGDIEAGSLICRFINCFRDASLQWGNEAFGSWQAILSFLLFSPSAQKVCLEIQQIKKKVLRPHIQKVQPTVYHQLALLRIDAMNVLSNEDLMAYIKAKNALRRVVMLIMTSINHLVPPSQSDEESPASQKQSASPARGDQEFGLYNNDEVEKTLDVIPMQQSWDANFSGKQGEQFRGREKDESAQCLSPSHLEQIREAQIQINSQHVGGGGGMAHTRQKSLTERDDFFSKQQEISCIEGALDEQAAFLEYENMIHNQEAQQLCTKNNQNLIGAISEQSFHVSPEQRRFVHNVHKGNVAVPPINLDLLCKTGSSQQEPEIQIVSVTKPEAHPNMLFLEETVQKTRPFVLVESTAKKDDYSQTRARKRKIEPNTEIKAAPQHILQKGIFDDFSSSSEEAQKEKEQEKEVSDQAKSQEQKNQSNEVKSVEISEQQLDSPQHDSEANPSQFDYGNTQTVENSPTSPSIQCIEQNESDLVLAEKMKQVLIEKIERCKEELNQLTAFENPRESNTPRGFNISPQKCITLSSAQKSPDNHTEDLEESDINTSTSLLSPNKPQLSPTSQSQHSQYAEHSLAIQRDTAQKDCDSILESPSPSKVVSRSNFQIMSPSPVMVSTANIREEESLKAFVNSEAELEQQDQELSPESIKLSFFSPTKLTSCFVKRDEVENDPHLAQRKLLKDKIAMSQRKEYHHTDAIDTDRASQQSQMPLNSKLEELLQKHRIQQENQSPSSRERRFKQRQEAILAKLNQHLGL